MKKNLSTTLLMIVIAALPFGYLAYIYPTLPDNVALHFDHNLQPDRIGPKTEIWIPVAILAGVSVLLYLLLTNLHRFDPKQRGKEGSKGFQKMAVVLVVFLAVLNAIIVTSAMQGALVFKNFLFPVLGIFFAFLGNYMNTIKPNYIAGFRLPWTLSSDDNWRRTHHLAGKLWFAGGLLIAVIGFIVPVKLMLPLFAIIMTVIGLLPAIYSYRLYKTSSPTPKNVL